MHRTLSRGYIMSACRRVSVLGLDGLCWWFLNKLFEKGAMPYTKRVVYKAYNYILEAAFPPMTYPSWTSIMTGVNPGKHGIFNFTYVDRSYRPSLIFKLFHALHLEHPRIHEILAMMGKRSLVINAIPGYPIIPMNRLYVINSAFTPKIMYYPDCMRSYAIKLRASEKKKKENLDMAIKNVMDYLGIVEDTIDKFSWDLYWIMLHYPDEMIHKFPTALLRMDLSVIKIFKLIDKIVELLASRSDALIIVSDHGFSKFSLAVSINDILLEHGLIEVRPPRSKVNAFKTKASITVTKYVEKIPVFARILWAIYAHLRAKFNVQVSYGKIDYEKSLAYMAKAQFYGIHLNKRDIATKVKEILKQYKGIKWVKTPKEVYKGPYISRAPDLLVMPDFDKGYKLASAKIHGAKYIAVDDYGHHPEGVLSVHCPDFTLSTTENKVPAWIVAPLILSILNIPLSHVTDDVDILEKITGTNIARKNYVAKWKIIRNMYKIKRI